MTHGTSEPKISRSGKILITGAGGFVGSAVLSRLLSEKVDAVGAVRHAIQSPSCVQVGALEEHEWTGLLANCRVVIHAAARVHLPADLTHSAIASYRATNVDGTLRLARQAVVAGVSRFVFLSSIKVNGEETEPGMAFSDDGAISPEGPYAVSKAEAEDGLYEIAAETGLEVVIIRPPLVYGPGVKANFLSMMRWLSSGVPLPLGAIKHNRRSLVALDNLVDLIVTCVDHPAAANQVFLAGDGEDLSTTDLLRRLAAAMCVPARLLPVPLWALRAGARLTGRDAIFQRLCGNLQVDISKARELLGWSPLIRVDEGLRRAARGGGA